METTFLQLQSPILIPLLCLSSPGWSPRFPFFMSKTAISQKEVLRQVKLAICKNRRQLLTSRMESVAGTDSQYALNQVLGKGVLLSKAGSAVYVTHCNSVNVEPRVHRNCTLEIPAVFNGSDVFVDPISLASSQWALWFVAMRWPLPDF